MHLRAITHRRPHRGFRVAQGEDLPQPGAPRESVDGGKVDLGAGYGGSATAGGAMHQNRVEGDGGVAHQTLRRTHPVCGQPGYVFRPSTRARPVGNHRRHSDKGGRMNIRRSRSGKDRLGEPPSLVPTIRSSKQVVAAEGSGLHGVAREWATPLGRLPCAD